MHKIAEKDEEAEFSLLVGDVIKSGYNPDETDGGISLVEVASTGHYSAGHRRALDRREQRDGIEEGVRK